MCRFVSIESMESKKVIFEAVFVIVRRNRQDKTAKCFIGNNRRRNKAIEFKKAIVYKFCSFDMTLDNLLLWCRFRNLAWKWQLKSHPTSKERRQLSIGSFRWRLVANQIPVTAWLRTSVVSLQHVTKIMWKVNVDSKIAPKFWLQEPRSEDWQYEE